ncbi:hypothetical protein OG552_20115 [Streptomyces sp. NBC_01476]|uniref:hypothetical protein n=1 Tax=Streptomyces sp. NBC_01476 TaxID=2903881 RepID=UPI002E313774|nr:hypothetical protein [Streptomyces sp. NBC_01476]
MEHNDDGTRRRRGRLFATVAGVAVLAAVAAGAVLVSDPSSAAPAASVPAPTRAGGSAAPAPTATATPTAAPAATGTTAPAAAHAAGRVENGVHTGDLRYFLAPPPAGADVYGDRAGSPLTADDIAVTATDESAARAALTAYGFRDGAYRTYLTADGVREVTVKLIRFAGPGQAAAYDAQQRGEGAQGTEIPLGADYPARAYHLASGSDESTDTVLVDSYQGDVHITLTVTGGRTPAGTQLRDLLDAQYQRLRTGH